MRIRVSARISTPLIPLPNFAYVNDLLENLLNWPDKKNDLVQNGAHLTHHIAWSQPASASDWDNDPQKKWPNWSPSISEVPKYLPSPHDKVWKALSLNMGLGIILTIKSN